MRFTSLIQVLELSSVEARSLLLGFETESLWDSMRDDHVAGGGMGMRGGAVCHIRAISAGVRA
jgi:hypothetical protein